VLDWGWEAAWVAVNGEPRQRRWSYEARWSGKRNVEEKECLSE
jgi:hypothetical protein